MAPRPCHIFILVIFAFSVLIKIDCKENNLEISLPNQGVIIGKEVSKARIHKIVGYYGIPYAQPPIGNLRFQAPQIFPLPSWSEPRNATEYQPACLQAKENFAEADLPFLQLLQNEPIRMHEDCLYLNIFVPLGGPVEESGYATMIWFHPGNFTTGDPSIWNPHALVYRHHLIVVTMSYRLNIMGFFTTGDGEAPGNFGLMDQQAAMQWVKDNIKLFGGNPDNISLMGSGTGGESIALHMINPISSKLFNKAVVMSAQLFDTKGVQNPLESAGPLLDRLVHSFSCIRTPTSQLIDCLRRADGELLVSATANEHWRPVIDAGLSNSTIPFLADYPKAMFDRGDFSPLPLLTGYTNMEDILAHLENTDTNITTEYLSEWLRMHADIPNVNNNDSVTCVYNTDALVDTVQFYYGADVPNTASDDVRQKMIHLNIAFGWSERKGILCLSNSTIPFLADYPKAMFERGDFSPLPLLTGYTNMEDILAHLENTDTNITTEYLSEWLRMHADIPNVNNNDSVTCVYNTDALLDSVQFYYGADVPNTASEDVRQKMIDSNIAFGWSARKGILCGLSNSTIPFLADYPKAMFERGDFSPLPLLTGYTNMEDILAHLENTDTNITTEYLSEWLRMHADIPNVNNNDSVTCVYNTDALVDTVQFYYGADVPNTASEDVRQKMIDSNIAFGWSARKGILCGLSNSTIPFLADYPKAMFDRGDFSPLPLLTGYTNMEDILAHLENTDTNITTEYLSEWLRMHADIPNVNNNDSVTCVYNTDALLDSVQFYYGADVPNTASEDVRQKMIHSNIAFGRSARKGILCLSNSTIPFLADYPKAMFDRGDFSPLPLLTGYTNMEDILAHLENTDTNITTEYLSEWLRMHADIPNVNNNDSVTCVYNTDALLDSVQFYYGADVPNTASEDVRRKMIDFLTEKRYGASTFQLANYVSTSQPTYVYRFDVKPITEGAIKDIPEWVTVPHLYDLIYIWGMPYWNDIGGKRWDLRDKSLSDTIMTFWVNFAKNSNPTKNSLYPITWDKFSTNTSSQILLINTSFTMSNKDNFNYKNIKFWNDYFPKLVDLTSQYCMPVEPNVAVLPVFSIMLPVFFIFVVLYC